MGRNRRVGNSYKETLFWGLPLYYCRAIFCQDLSVSFDRLALTTCMITFSFLCPFLILSLIMLSHPHQTSGFLSACHPSLAVLCLFFSTVLKFEFIMNMIILIFFLMLEFCWLQFRTCIVGLIQISLEQELLYLSQFSSPCWLELLFLHFQKRCLCCAMNYADLLTAP